MLYFFWSGYKVTDSSYHTYEMANDEIAKWGEFYLSKKTPFCNSNWAVGKVTDNPSDILLGHTTFVWNPLQFKNSSVPNWVKDNALSKAELSHPNTYILIPWVSEMENFHPNENSPFFEEQCLSAQKIFVLCGKYWYEKTLEKNDNSFAARLKHKIVHLNMGIAAHNLPFNNNKAFNPIGCRKLLHISNLEYYKGFDITCKSLVGLNDILYVASTNLNGQMGKVTYNIDENVSYTFNSLGIVNNSDPQFNKWVSDTCDFYIHTARYDAQATVILENIARGLIPLVTPESGFSSPYAIELTFDPEKNREIIEWALNLPEENLLERSFYLRRQLQEEHNWENIFETIWTEINSDINQQKVDLEISRKNNILCKVCGSTSEHFDSAVILEKYKINYFQCPICGFIQTEESYWLQESYSNVIANSDIGILFRNKIFSNIANNILFSLFNHNAKFLDYAGGYGIFTRTMRDLGYDFYWDDKYCQNIFAKHFEHQIGAQYELITAFEVFEHFVNPIEEIEKILKLSKNILFSTELLPPNNPKPNEWHYYALQEGQHIALYTIKSLSIIAKKFGLNFYSNGSSLHLFTEKSISPELFSQLCSHSPQDLRKPSLLHQDYQMVVNSLKDKNKEKQTSLKVLVDGVFFQFDSSGIARVWISLLKEWVRNGFAKHIVVLDRNGTMPKITGVQYRAIEPYSYAKTDYDRKMLQQICNEENANLFISTYYTTPISTPSIFMAYDMIPELLNQGLDSPVWKEKHFAIRQAHSYITISKNTANDLVKYFPYISPSMITVAYCGIEKEFQPININELNSFKQKYNITQPYFLLVGERIGWLGYKNAGLFFRAFSLLLNKEQISIVCVGGKTQLEDVLLPYVQNIKVHLVRLSDDELKAAYSGAITLVYPSKYEGFGLPVLEALACGCPVITCPNGSIPEVGGDAALYVNDNSVEEMIKALENVQNPKLRQPLVTRGLEQARKFSWEKMAKIVSTVLVETADKIASSPDGNILIATSIAPRNTDVQVAAINSWVSQGFSIISFNIQEEIEQLKDLFNDVQFVCVSRDARLETGKPLVYLDDIFSYFKTINTDICGIINSDIHLKPTNDFLAMIKKEIDNSIIFSSRVDVDSLEYPMGKMYLHGFDVFFLDKSVLTQIPSSLFCLGAPWWDYFIPMIAQQKSLSLKYLVTPFAYHVKHQINYQAQTWLKFGIYFTKLFSINSFEKYQYIGLTHQIEKESMVDLSSKLSLLSNQVIESTQKYSKILTLETDRVLVQSWLDLSEENLEQAYQGDLGKKHQELIGSGFRNNLFSVEEKRFISQLNQYIAKGWKQDKIAQHFLAASLYCYPHQLPEKWFENAEVPEFLVDYFVNFMFETPSFFKELSEVSQYYQYIKNWVDFIHLGVTTEPDSPLWQQMAWFFTQRANFISLYCSTENLKEIYVKRAEIMEIALKQKGFQLEHSFPPREKNRKKIRLGILSMHFIPQTETFATLPVFEYLDRSFEIILYTSKITNHPLEQYCESRADRLVQLPEDVQSQVTMLREDDLDILWMVNNVTAVTHNLTLLALHRLARLQMTSFCSPTTTGMRHVDYFIAGELSSDGHQEQFSEQLVTIKGSGICFNYATEYEPPTIEATKAKFGIPENKVVLISGANFYKIIPELRETWAKVLAAAPNTVLVLYPFGPAWSSSYPKEPFIKMLYMALEKQGAAKEQLIILEQLPTRGDVKELLKLADIYLDSYPYSGATSLLDPLSIGLPMVLMSGNALRFRQGVAMLSSIGLDGLITQDEESYINLAVKLGANAELRKQYREQILEKMANNPPFLDSKAYSAQIGNVLKQLFERNIG
ncbi:MAG: hypothetical protein RJA13_722 [Bacteroidota bacterium]|jgi:predicted O-linked N-acetylglucosamine transferase (SPINDLY family)/glycosyltransferase involved in cell wall biosynthesis